MNKIIKFFLIIFSIILIIGTLIPLIFSFSQNNKDIYVEIKTEARTSIPKLLKLTTIYQSFSEENNGTIIASTHTLFNITLQKIYFKTGDNEGTTIEYFPFSK